MEQYPLAREEEDPSMVVEGAALDGSGFVAHQYTIIDGVGVVIQSIEERTNELGFTIPWTTLPSTSTSTTESAREDHTQEDSMVVGGAAFDGSGFVAHQYTIIDGIGVVIESIEEITNGLGFTIPWTTLPSTSTSTTESPREDHTQEDSMVVGGEAFDGSGFVEHQYTIIDGIGVVIQSIEEITIGLGFTIPWTTLPSTSTPTSKMESATQEDSMVVGGAAFDGSGFVKHQDKIIDGNGVVIQEITNGLGFTVPPIYDLAHSSAFPEDHRNFLKWVRASVEWLQKSGNSDLAKRLLNWAHSITEMTIAPGPEAHKNLKRFAHSTPTMDEPKRLLKWADSSTVAAPDRWSLQEEIAKSFETAMTSIQEAVKQSATELNTSYPDLKHENIIYTCRKGMHDDYQCLNALWIWPKLEKSHALTYSQTKRGPRYVGEQIGKTFPESDMIEGRPVIHEFGIVTVRLSGKWIAKSVHKMLKDGIDTWAPKLRVERVMVHYPSLEEEIHVDLFRRRAIGYTLIRILEYSKVDVSNLVHDMDIVAKTFPTYSERDGIYSDQEVPFIRAMGDPDIAYKDLFALWYGLCMQKADWIVYVTPIRQQEYIEMCFNAVQKWKSDRHKPVRTSYAGYRTCTTELEDHLLDKAKARCVAVEQGEAAKLLGYTAKAVLDCVFTYTFLKNHRLAVWTFDIDEMLNEQGNTFVYLLNTQAKVCKITDDSRNDINELKKASDLILLKDDGWENGEERMLGFHLLEFTEALEESCLSVLPHILCEYLYDLSTKFNSYYSSVCKVGSVAETSTLLLCEATAVVMKKCFQLLGITPTSSLFELSMTQLFSGPKRPMDLNTRDPPRHSRFELFSFRPAVSTHFGSRKGKLFGLISVSDKFGSLLDGRSQFFEPDFAHVPLFNHDWCNPVKMIDNGIVFLGNPSSRHSVPFSSSIEIRMELYVTKKREECYQLCNHKKKIDLSDFWDKKLDGESGQLSVKGEDGTTTFYYTLLKDAIDTTLEVEFVTNTRSRKVLGYVLAYYGDEFLHECQCPPSEKYNYSALLFLPDPDHFLKAGKLQLIKSVLAVPTKGSLIFKAYLEDAESGQVIMKSCYKFKSQLKGCRSGIIRGVEGEDCYLDLKVHWMYQA